MNSEEKPRKNNVTHTRAIQRERSMQPLREPPDESMEQLLEELVSPIVYSQIASYQAMGLRQRILTLPVMVAFVLSLIWRQAGSVMDGLRELKQRGMLWAEPVVVSQQAVSERLRTFPAQLFERILLDLLPQMQLRWAARIRALPEVITFCLGQFQEVVILDGSTLDALLRKVGLLREGKGPILAGRMAALLDVASRLPKKIWYEEDSQAHDRVFWEGAIAELPKGVLLLFDLGFLNHHNFEDLCDRLIFFVTRLKQKAVFEVQTVLQENDHLHDWIVYLGKGKKRCQHTYRVVEVAYQGGWYRYLTNVLDPVRLPATYVAQIYQQRWRIEDAFYVAKRQLGLAYFWVGSINGVKVQLWATWLLYAVLVDLTDRVAEAFKRPFADISMEMVFKGLYHFTQEKHLGRASDPVSFLVQNAALLGILKQRHRRLTNIDSP